jgi:hypothetical protein
MIMSGEGEELYDRRVWPTINDFMGLIYEDMCKQYLQEQNRQNRLPLKIQNMGRWWGNNALRRSEMEIDIVAINDDEQAAIYGECKYRNESVDCEILEKLVEGVSIFTKYPQKYYALFSKAGFTERLQKIAADRKCILVSLTDMYID